MLLLLLQINVTPDVVKLSRFSANNEYSYSKTDNTLAVCYDNHHVNQGVLKTSQLRSKFWSVSYRVQQGFFRSKVSPFSLG